MACGVRIASSGGWGGGKGVQVCRVVEVDRWLRWVLLMGRVTVRFFLLPQSGQQQQHRWRLSFSSLESRKTTTGTVFYCLPKVMSCVYSVGLRAA